MNKYELEMVRKAGCSPIFFSSYKTDPNDKFGVRFEFYQVGKEYFSKIELPAASNYNNRTVCQEEWEWTFPDATIRDGVLTLHSVKSGYDGLFGWEPDKILDITTFINKTIKMAIKAYHFGKEERVIEQLEFYF